MAQKHRIAILSDLHLGNTRKEMNYNNDSPSRPNYLDSFSDFTTRNEIKADYIIIPGDISDRGTEDQFKDFCEFIDKVSCALKTPKNNIIIAPGNHDKNWKIGDAHKESATTNRIQKSYDPYLTELKEILNTENQCGNSHAESPYFKIWEDEHLYCITFNSAAEDFAETAPHYGTAHHSVIESLDSLLKVEANKIKNKIKIFVCHHHPLQYSSPLNDIFPDFSIMGNSEGILKILHNHSFDLLIHGHKHIPNFDIHANQLAHPLICFCAGSFSANLSHDYQGLATNLFHLVEAEKENCHKPVTGKLRSWSYLVGKRWHKADQNIAGIDPQISFGTWTSVYEIEQKLKTLIQPQLNAGKKVLFSSLYDSDPTLEHIPNSTKMAAISSLEKKLKFKALRYEEDLILIGE
ncbi:metallophosphoesterase [Alcanivorax sp. NBRC 102028]|uniref:metallophosphoesterase family protein n=1 Tax=Alcanivorax sp. NBRC 102028 TaxID=1113897 RepID=UPI000789DE6A|nr:metallophosphoesterase [Alcanivorax sp. NBRC 102028]